MSVTSLHRTTVQQLAFGSQADPRLHRAETWAQILAAYGLDAIDVEASGRDYFRELLVRGLEDGLSFGGAHAVAAGDLLAHGLIWGRRLP